MSKSKVPVIRQLAAPYDGPRIAAAEFESVVSIWELTTRKRVSIFETPLDFGGQRLAINSRGDNCSIASYVYGGVACYHTETAALIWAKKKLAKPQYIAYSNDDQRLYCGGDGRPCISLDPTTGEELGRYPSTDRVISSAFQPIELLNKTRGGVLSFEKAGRSSLRLSSRQASPVRRDFRTRSSVHQRDGRTGGAVWMPATALRFGGTIPKRGDMC